MRHDASAHHHILPVRVYLTIGGLLLLMTAITVAVAQFDFGEANLIVAMVIAGFKASLVVLYFMHLRYDNKFYSMIFAASLVFLGLFIGLTMLDTLRRDDIYDQVAHPINKQAVMPNRGTSHNAAPAGHNGSAAPADTTMSKQTAPTDTVKAPTADSSKIDTSGKKTH